MIPKLLHYVWVGGPLPPLQQNYLDSWRQTNPDFTIICWNEQNIDMSSEIIRTAYQQKKWAKVADVARLQAVQQMGGIYFDTDFRLVRPIDKLLRHKCFFAFQETDPHSTDWVCNGVFGAEPGHWFVTQVLNGLLEMKPNRLLPERPTSFGPKHVTRLLRQAGLRDYSNDGVMVKDIFIAPVSWFFPFHFSEEFTEDCITEATLGVHFWEKSWETAVPLYVRVGKKVLQVGRKAARLKNMMLRQFS